MEFGGYYILVPVLVFTGCYMIFTPTVFAVPVVHLPPNLKNSTMKIELETIDLSGNLVKDPMQLFNAWRDEAKTLPENKLVDAMTLSTVKSDDGAPASRTVLLRGLDSEGMKMYTDYTSSKGQDIEKNPKVSLVFVWFFKKPNGVLGNRQVRVEGIAEKLPVPESQAYFDSEPIMAQIRTVIQSQSARIIDNRASLLERGETLLRKYETDPKGFKLAMPSTWGGYKIRPETMEFYQGTRDAINDRVKFFKNETPEGEPLPVGVFLGEGGWVYEQLEP